MVTTTFTPDSSLSLAPEKALIIDGGAAAGVAISLPLNEFLFTANFDREANDLIIEGQDGRSIIVEDYFLSGNPSDLQTTEGATLKGDIVEVLAGPDQKGAYAQAGTPAGGTPIGQVEIVEGEATVQRTDGTVEVLQVGTKVFQNDVVQTSDGATLSITFADETVFTLSSSSRMVLSELVYAPEGENNSAVFNLVVGSFAFVAGQVAKTGEMEVDTPSATMGIRGTTVLVDITTDANGTVVVQVSLTRDIDGSIGSIELVNKLDGSVNLITTVDSNWVISTADGITTEIPRTVSDDASDQEIINDVFDAVRSVQERVAAGEQPVQLDDIGEDEGQNEGDQQDPDTDTQEEEQTDDEDIGDQGSLGSGLETELAETNPLGELPEIPTGTFGDSETSGGEDGPAEDTELADNTEDDEIIVPDTTPPGLTVPGTAVVAEDGSISLTGISVTPGSTNNISATLTAGSTIELTPGSGVTIDLANSVESPPGSGRFDVLVINGTAAQVTAALDGVIYRPSVNDPDGRGSLTIEITDGGVTETATITVNITQVVFVNEGGVSGLSIADFDTFGVDTTSGNPVFTVNSVTNGSIIVSGVAATTFTLSDLNAGVVELVHDGSETTSAEINFSVANLGDSVTNTTIARVAPVNDDPFFLGDLTAETGEGGTIILTPGDLAAADVEQSNGDLTFVVNTVTNGTLLVGGVAGTTFTIADISAGDVAFEHDGTEDPTGTISVTVDDGVGGSATETVTVNITPVNDDPVLAGDLNITANEGGSVAITLADLTASDLDNTAGELTFTLDSATNGTVLVGGVASTTFTLADITAGDVEYVHDASETTSASINVTVDDGAGGTDTSTIAVTVNPVNDVPDGFDNESGDDPIVERADGAANENTGTITERAFVLRFDDVDTDGTPPTFTAIGDSGNSSSIEALVSFSFQYSAGSPVGDRDTVDVFATVDAADLDFLAAGETIELNYTLQITDSDGGSSSTTSPSTQFRVRLVGTNDGPEIQGDLSTLVVEGDGNRVTILAADLSAIDVDNDSADLSFTVNSVSNGQVLVGGSPATSFTLQDVLNNIVQYRHDGSENATETIELTVTDGTSTSDVTTFTLNVQNTNDTPVITGDLTSAVVEGGSVTITAADLGATDVDNASDDLTFTLGTVTNGLVTVGGSTSSIFTLADIAAGNVVYTHDGTETATGSIGFTVNDGAGGSASGTIALTVGATNDNPEILGDLAIAVNEGGSVVLTAADLDGFDTEQADADLTFTVNSATNGTIQVGGSASSTFTLADITAGIVEYVHDGSETTSSAINVTLDDSVGGTDTATIAATVTPQNDTPTFNPGGRSVNEDNGPRGVDLSALADDGDIGEDGTTLTYQANLVSEFFDSGVSISGSTLNFNPSGLFDNLHQGESTQVVISVTATDGEGASATNDITITVNGQNDLPTVTGTPEQEADFVEGAGPVEVNDTITISDVDGNATGADIITRGSVGFVSTTSANYVFGEDVLALDVSAIGLDGVFDSITFNATFGELIITGDATSAQYAQALEAVTYVNLSDTPQTHDRQLVTVVDDGFGPALVRAQSTVTVTAANDDPEVTGGLSILLDEGGSETVITGDLFGIDVDNAPGDLLFTVDSVTNGSVLVNGSPASTFTISDIENAFVEFLHDGSETSTGSFDVTLSDGAGGTDTATVSVTVNPVNDEPEITGDLSVGTTEGGSVTLTVSDVNGIDADNTDGELTFTIGSVTNGTVTVGGNAETTFSLAELIAGQVVYLHDGSDTTTGSIGLTLDDGAGGSDTATVSVSVTPSNDDPEITGDLTVGGIEGFTATITTADLNGVDTDNTSAELSFAVNSVTNGSITVGGTPSSTFTIADIVAGDVQFFHDGSETTTGAIELTLSDGAGGSDTATVAISVTPANDDPEISGDLTVGTIEATPVTLTVLDINGADVDNLPAELTFTVDSVINGSITVGGTPSSSFTIANLTAGQVVYLHDGSETTAGSIEVTLSDGAGGSDTATISVSVTPANDDPEITGDLSTSVNEGGSVTLTSADLSGIDVDSAPAGLSFAIDSFTNGTILVNGSPSASFTIADITAGNVEFVHDGSETTTGSVEVTLQDGAGGTDQAIVSVAVTPVNDDPVITGDLSIDAVEGSSTILTAADLGGTDAEQSDGDFTYNVTGTTNGDVQVFGSPVSSFTQADLDSGYVEFLHDGSETTTGSFSVSLTDGVGGSDTATITVTVSPSNDAPLIALDSQFDTGSNLIVNGDFESGPDLTGLGLDRIVVNAGDSSTITGWSVTSGQVDYADDSAIGVVDGERAIDLDGDIPGRIEQSITTEIGATYSLTFQVAANLALGQVFHGLQVTAGNVVEDLVIERQVPPNSQFSPGFELVTVVFTATATTSTIAFESTSPVNFEITGDGVTGPTIDSVSVREIGRSTTEDTPVLIEGVSFADVDATAPQVTVTAVNGTIDFTSGTDDGGLTGISGLGTTSLTFTGPLAIVQSLVANSLEFTPDTNFSGVATVDITVNDLGQTGIGGSQSDTVTIEIAVPNGNDAPVVTTDANVRTDFLEGDDPVIVNDTITVTDVDGGTNGPTQLTTASVGFRTNYVAGEDVLTFTDYGPFTHNFNVGTGLLVIFGNATPAEFQAALRSVRYENVSENPSGLIREMEFRASDGVVGGDSVIVTSEINPTGVNDAPSIIFENPDLDGFAVNDSNSAGSPDPTLRLVNNGTGIVSTVIQPPETRSSDIALGDIDGDGDLDGILVNFGQENRILLNQGGIQGGTEGNFSNAQLLPGGSDNSLGVALGDVDNDGDLDILVANWVGSSSEILINQGGIQGGLEGTFNVSNLVGSTTGGPSGFRQGRDVALADLDGDGDLDAIIANGQSANQLYINQGGDQGGTLGSFTTSSNLPFVVTPASGIVSLSVTLGDIDGDGDIDAIIGNSGAENEVLLNNGSGGFTASTLVGGVRDTREIALGDLDGDGDLDMVIANGGSNNQNQVLINQGGDQGGSEGTYVASDIDVSFGSSADVTLADVDGDGDLDAIIANNAFTNAVSQTNQILVNDGTGDFSALVMPGGNSATNAIVFGDLDGDAVFNLGENIVLNGSFEISPSGGFPVSGIVTPTAGDNVTITNWNVFRNNVDLFNEDHFLAEAATDGNNAIDLNGFADGGISQQLELEIGTTYLLTFDHSGDPANGESVTDLTVAIGGDVFETVSYTEPVGATRADPGFVTHQIGFTATSATQLLTFSSADPGNTGALLDNVQIREVGTTMIENTSLVLDNLVIEDPDASTPFIAVSVVNGTIDFATGADTSSLTLISGAGTDAMTFRGPIADLETLVADFLEFTPDTNFTGVAEVEIKINDAGQVGQGVAQEDAVTVYIGVQDDPFGGFGVASSEQSLDFSNVTELATFNGKEVENNPISNPFAGSQSSDATEIFSLGDDLLTDQTDASLNLDGGSSSGDSNWNLEGSDSGFSSGDYADGSGAASSAPVEDDVVVNVVA